MQPPPDIVPVARGNIEPPYCWQSKTALRKIREAFDGDTFLDQAFAVYLIHCELSSDKTSSIYEARLRTIAERSGVSPRRVSEIHQRLKKIGLLDWKQNRIEGTSELGASTFTLLSCVPSDTSCTPRNTPGTASATYGTSRDRSCKNQNSDFARSIEESIETTSLKNLSESGERDKGAGDRPDVLAEIVAYGAAHSIPVEACYKWHAWVKSTRKEERWRNGFLTAWRRKQQGRGVIFDLP